MKRVIAVAGQKGGSGKSTILLHLAVEAIRDGKTVTVVDLDPQATASKWSDRRESDTPVVVSAQAERLGKVLGEITTDYVYIDTQGRASGEAMVVARQSDLILLPCRPTIGDVETLTVVADILRLTSAVPLAHVVWNACLTPTDTRIAGGLDLVTDIGLTASPHVICQRVAYADSMIAGMTAAELDPSSKAATEMTALYAWTMEMMR